MQKITILGHINQDTDATCAGLALEELFKTAKLYKATLKISDKPNRETEFILKNFKVKVPKKFSKKSKTPVFLIDHNEKDQSPVDLKNVELEGLVDHHKLNISIDKEYPIIFRVEPIGSSSSIVAKMFKDYKIKPSRKIATLMLAGIISDTLKFSSPTTTEEDKDIAQELAKITGQDINKLAKEMFGAKSNLKGVKPRDIITSDYKKFQFGKFKTGIGVLETVSPENAFLVERGIRKALSEYKKKERLDLIFFGIVDIINNSTVLILIGSEEENAAMKAFKQKAIDGIMKLPGVVSRKKQLAPDFARCLK